MRSGAGSISTRAVAVLCSVVIGCGGHVSVDAERSSGHPRTVDAGAGSGGAPSAPASGGSSSRSDGGSSSPGSGGHAGFTAGAGGARSGGGQGSLDGGFGATETGVGGAVEPPPAVCAPLVDGGSLFSSAACGTVQQSGLPTGAGLPFGASGPFVPVGFDGIVTLRDESTPGAGLGVYAFDPSTRCLGELAVEKHPFNRSAGITDAQIRGEVAAVLVDCNSDSGSCGSTLYINGKLALDLTQDPVDPLSTAYSRMALDPDGNVLLATDTKRIGNDVAHRVRLVSHDGTVLKDAILPSDRFTTDAVAADLQGRLVIALVGQPAAGQARSALEVLDRDLNRLTFLELREDIELNALWADSPDTVIAVGQEGAPDPYGYVEALSIPDLHSVWPAHPHFPLGYARAVDVAKDGVVWVVGDDPNLATWLAAYDPTSMMVTIAPPPAPANDHFFGTWSIGVLDDGSVLFAHASLYSYCR